MFFERHGSVYNDHQFCCSGRGDVDFVDATDYACLSVTFGAACTVLSWLLYEDIKAHEVDVFTDTAVTMLADNTDDTVRDLESGRTDAALLRADGLAHVEETGIITGFTSYPVQHKL
ncbi:hypothetical protein WJX77_006507 [Trebouxia sp. C0004]